MDVYTVLGSIIMWKKNVKKATFIRIYENKQNDSLKLNKQ